MSCKQGKDLLEFIDWSHVECLNEQPSHPIANVLKQGYREDEGLFLESDADEQLLINIPFSQHVKLTHLLIKAADADAGPKTVKLFINNATMGFSDATTLAPVQIIELSAEDLAGEKPIELKFVKFQNVRTLSVFVEDNQNSEDTTKIAKIAVFGLGVETTNMNELKKVG